jgi:copper homeostasis protein
VYDLDRGGLTPSVSLVESILERVRIPIRVMVREEEPFVPTGAGVVDAMMARVRDFAALPIDGIVVGVLDRDRHVDVAALRRLLQPAPGVPVTFHRAFEEVADQTAAIATLAAEQAVDTVLTSAGAGSWSERLDRLRAIAAQASRGFRVLAAVGVDRAVTDAIDTSWPFDIHVGRAARDPERNDAPVSARRVRRLAMQLRG